MSYKSINETFPSLHPTRRYGLRSHLLTYGSKALWAEHIGFRTQGVRVSFEQLVEDVPLPCILHWNQNHFVVCYEIKEEKTFWGKKTGESKIYISDPASGQAVFTKEEFLKCWLSTWTTSWCWTKDELWTRYVQRTDNPKRCLLSVGKKSVGVGAIEKSQKLIVNN